jgi:outer membrane usher protein
MGPLIASLAHAEDMQAAPLTLFVNEKQEATSTVFLRGNDALVLRKDLEDAGLRHVPATSEETIDGRTYISLAQLTPAVRYRIDERTLELRIHAPPQYFDTAVINLRQGAPRDIVQHRDVGAFFNYAPRLIDFRTLAASGEGGVSVGGHLLYSGISYDPTNRVLRGLTNLTIDEPQEMRRWVFGDSFVAGGGPLGGAVFLGGLSVGRAFELDPYFIKFPTPTTIGTALSASTVDVYVNGVLQRRVPVNPGTFQLQNIAAAGGAGTIRYVLRDAFGREQQVVSSFYASPGVLSRGVSDYGLAVGAIRHRFGAASWDYGGPALFGRYRVGLTDALTVGLRLEAPLDPSQLGASTGLSLTLLQPIGQIDLAVGVSTASPGDNGLAGAASYLYQAQYFAGGLSARIMSDDYFTLSLSPIDDRARFAGAAFVSIPAGRRVTLTTNCILGISRDHGTSGAISEQAAVRLTNAVQLSATASRTRYEDGTSPAEAFATLTVALGGSVFASASGHVGKSQPLGRVDLSKPLPAGSGYGFQASAMRGATTTFSGATEGQLQQGRARLEVVSVNGEVHGSISMAGGIVAVPGAGVFFTRPVHGGYAVIHVPGAKNVRGYLNNNEIGRTDAAGNLIVPNLLAYFGNRLSVNDKDLPLDYKIDAVEEVVATPHRGSALVRFAAKRTWFVRGTLVVRRPGSEKDVIPAYGEVIMDSGKLLLTSPIAREGEFEFEQLAAGQHAMRIEYAEGICEMTLIVPVSEGPISDVGALVCEAQ